MQGKFYTLGYNYEKSLEESMNAGEAIDRLKTITNTKNDAELARKLGKTPTVVYTWRSRNTLNHEIANRNIKRDNNIH